MSYGDVDSEPVSVKFLRATANRSGVDRFSYACA